MTYTVSFDLFIDGDEILSEAEIKEFLKDEIDSSAISISNVKLIEDFARTLVASAMS